MSSRRPALAVLAVGALALSTLAAAPAHASVSVSNLVLNVGADESQRNVSWLGTAGAPDYVQIAQVTGNQSWNKAWTVKPYAQGAAETRAGIEYNHVALTGLKTNTTYQYRVCAAANDCGETNTFSTSPKGNFNFLVYGDPQLYVGGTKAAQTWQQTLATSTSMFPKSAFLFSMGDQIDSTGAVPQAQEWDLFFDSPVLRQYPLSVSLGNHDNSGGKGVQYAQNNAIPNVSELGATAAGSGDYFYTVNGVLFMVLNTNNRDLEQHREFMEQTLAANPGTSWQVVQFHQSPFSSASHINDSDVVKFRTELTPILSELGIDVVFGGHDHDYTRTFLMAGDQPVPGTGGDKLAARDGQVLYIATNSASGSKYYGLLGPNDWAAVMNQEKVPNFTNVEVKGNAMTITTYRLDGSVVDSVSLTHAHGK